MERLYRVLLVDDQEIIKIELQRYLKWQDYGFEISGTCEDGQEALNFLKDNYVDLVITDIRMPVMDGLELLKELRIQYPELIVVFLSDYGEFSLAKEGIEYGLFSYLTKPVKLNELKLLLPKVKKYLDDKMTDFSFETTQLLKCYLNLETDINESYQKLKNKIESLEKDEGRAKIILENKLQEVYSELNKEYPWLNKYIYLSEDKLEDFMNMAYLFIRHNLLLLGNNHYVRSIALMVIAKVEEKLAQEDIAATLFLSKNYIGELFKMETGRNLKDYIADIKVARAKVLLFEGSHKWYEIANMLSYSNVEYFAGLFKKKVGLTPKEFKESGKFLIL